MRVKKILENKKDKNYLGIRVSIKTRDCSSLSYAIGYDIKDKNITKFDDISIFLVGSEMIYKKTDLEEGFDFVNTNEKARFCFGESFTVQ